MNLILNIRTGMLLILTVFPFAFVNALQMPPSAENLNTGNIRLAQNSRDKTPAYCEAVPAEKPDWVNNPQIPGQYAASGNAQDDDLQNARNQASGAAISELAQMISSNVVSESVSRKSKDSDGVVTVEFNQASAVKSELRNFSGYTLKYWTDTERCLVWALASIEEGLAVAVGNLKYAEYLMSEAESSNHTLKKKIAFAEVALEQLALINPAYRSKLGAYDADQAATKKLLVNLKRQVPQQAVIFVVDANSKVPGSDLSGILMRALPDGWRQINEPCESPDDCARIADAFAAKNLLVFQTDGYTQKNSLFKEGWLVIRIDFRDLIHSGNDYVEEFKIQKGFSSGAVIWRKIAEKAVAGDDWKTFLRKLQTSP